MQINYVDYGIANRYDDQIDLNENLKSYPGLHDAILKHELSHTDKTGITKQDLLTDFGEHRVNQFELVKFVLKHPKAFIQFAPIYKRRGTIFYDLNMMIFWSLLLCVGFLSFYLTSL